MAAAVAVVRTCFAEASRHGQSVESIRLGVFKATFGCRQDDPDDSA
jgi:hypothetical protein